MRIGNHAQRRGINEINVAPDQFGESRLGPGLGILAEKFLVAHGVHASSSTRPVENRTGNKTRKIASAGGAGPEMIDGAARLFLAPVARLQLRCRGAAARLKN